VSSLRQDRVRGVVTQTRVVDISDLALAAESTYSLSLKASRRPARSSYAVRPTKSSGSHLQSASGEWSTSPTETTSRPRTRGQETGTAAEVFVSQLVAPNERRIEACGAKVTRTDGPPLDAEKSRTALRLRRPTALYLAIQRHRCDGRAGTVAVEILEQVPSVDAVFVTVGGGGLIGGMGAFQNTLRPPRKSWLLAAELAGAL